MRESDTIELRVGAAIVALVVALLTASNATAQTAPVAVPVRTFSAACTGSIPLAGSTPMFQHCKDDRATTSGESLGKVDLGANLVYSSASFVSDSGASFTSGASLVYYVFVLGPAASTGLLVPLNVASEAVATASGPAIAQALVEYNGGVLGDACSAPQNPAYCPPGSSSSFSHYGTTIDNVRAVVNVPQKVTLISGAIASGGGIAIATADPYFTIDPSTPNAGQYTLAFSEGVVNALPSGMVPEPSTFVLLASSLIGLAVWRRIQTV
jgi:hypothetical protein